MKTFYQVLKWIVYIAAVLYSLSSQFNRFAPLMVVISLILIDVGFNWFKDKRNERK